MRAHKDLKVINPASGAIVMALGIFLYAAIEDFPTLESLFGQWLTVAFTIIGTTIYFSLTRQFFQKEFLLPFLKNPVNSFVMGTWIAGMSVLCNVMFKYFPGLSMLVHGMAIVNTALYILFVASCLYNFKELFRRPDFHATHGVVLLSTVATQSIVIVWAEMFPAIPRELVIAFVILGILFYLGGLALIAFRYGKMKQWSLTDDWTNTNCIIHGALSITGLAMVSSEVLSASYMMMFWVLVFSLLVLVEVLEVTRAVKRMRHYGFKKGVFTYEISQWSRNFTFGMFYAYSAAMHENPYYMNAMYGFHEVFLHIWAWVVLITLVLECIIWLESRLPHVSKSTQ